MFCESCDRLLRGSERGRELCHDCSRGGDNVEKIIGGAVVGGLLGGPVGALAGGIVGDLLGTKRRR